MICPSCQHPYTRVKDSRPKGDDTRRRRICPICAHTFGTIELATAEYQKLRRATAPMVAARFRKRIAHAVAILSEPDK